MRTYYIAITSALAFFQLTFAGAQTFKPETSYHNDGRSSPRQEFISPPQAASGSRTKNIKNPLDSAREYLRDNADKYGIEKDLGNLKLTDKQSSLLGSHFKFQQYFDNKEVITGQIVVTTNKAGDVTEVSNNIFPMTAPAGKTGDDAKISSDAAFDAAWKDLKVPPDAKLLSEPVSELKYLPVGGAFRLVYDIKLSVSKPAGSWQFAVAADTGEILRKEARSSSLDKFEEAQIPDGPLADRNEIFSAFRKASDLESTRTKSVSAPQRANGTGFVFDPDPVTQLKDETLTLNSPAAQFDGAYTNVILKDLRKEGGVYRLDGPWVRIVDKEPPSTPPSTSKDGHWSAKRGDNAFNDVMTYYHIDQAQRYLHGLGFNSVINHPIEADSDAENGDDNSHHHPGANGKAGFLTFGHGCVPDNEDASVIWHEFGHAIHADIVALNWSGGDSGAIGEGFGDYWAASHNLSTQAGKGFKPGRVFKWDGIASCWGGRSVELQNFKYDPGRDYGAHQKLDPRFGNNSPATDELWSSPLFQAQLALIEKGKKREEADKIVVQSLFGLTSSGFKMRDVAQRIVNTAQKLYPNGPHAAIFLAKFQEYNICPQGVANSCPDNPPMSKTGDPQEVTLAPSVKK